MIILSNDPSLTAWGWSVYDTISKRIISYGVFKTAPSPKKLKIRKGDDRVRRVQELSENLLKVIKEYRVDYIISELPHGSQSAVAAVMIGLCIGVLQSLSTSLSIPIEWYYEMDCKSMIFGRRDVSKEQVMSKMYTEFALPISPPKTMVEKEAVADSLSILYTAMRCSEVIKLKLYEK